MTGGSLNIKLVENLFSICLPMMSVSQLIALMEKTLEILENSALLRQLKRFQKTMMKVTMMVRTSMKTETFLSTEDVVSGVDDDLAIDDEEYHEALLDDRET